jgi:glycine betaine/choline ABC-type transport system substrate-binding protein
MSLSERLRPDVEAAPWVIEEVTVLEAEIERLNKNLHLFVTEARTNHNNWAAAVRERDAEIEKLKKVYDAARGLCHGHDWNNGTQALRHKYRMKLIVAVNAIEPLPDQYRIMRARAALNKEEGQ